MATDENINFSEDYTLDNSETYSNEYPNCYGGIGAPVVLSNPGFVQNIFQRECTDAGPLVLTTTLFDRGTGTVTFNATCSHDLILVKLLNVVADTQAVALPAPSDCAGKVFVIKEITGYASVTNHIDITPTSGTIDGISQIELSTPYGAVWLMSDGTNYKLLEVL